MGKKQTKKGYLRGVRGVLLIPLESTGAMPTWATPHWIDTAQEVGIDAEVVDGESADLRGGDRLLVRLEEDDVVVGATLTFRDARFDAKAAEVVGGGTLIYDAVTDEIIGWDAPTITQQANKVPFAAHVYVQSFNAQGGREAYLKYSFRYCKGRAPTLTHTDQDWGTPEFTVKATENPATGLSTYKKEFVASLPATPPENLTADTGYDAGSVDLVWDAVDGAVTYTVYSYKGAAAPADVADWVVMDAVVATNAFEATGLDTGAVYTFAVRAENTEGLSNLSDVATVAAG